MRHRSFLADRIVAQHRRWATASSFTDQLARLRELDQRRFIKRDLSPEEENERQGLKSNFSGLRDDLANRWDNMEDLSPDELQTARTISGPHRFSTPDDWDDTTKGTRLSFLRDRVREGDQHMTPRELAHHAALEEWAAPHEVNMRTDAQNELQHWDEAKRTGNVPFMSPLDHEPGMTGLWAQHMQEHTGKYTPISGLAQKYRAALENVAQHGPFARPADPTGSYGDPGYSEQMRAANKTHAHHLEGAKNRLRVELQHRDEFQVPSIHEMSQLQEPVGPLQHLETLNPRYSASFPESRSEAAQRRYKVNCQRATLAHEARSRGLNVEARPNTEGRDEAFTDHRIASLYPNKDGSVPVWTDPEDQGHEGPAGWDAMHKDIQSWGPGARGVVAFTHGGGVARHIINTHVDDQGQVHYLDPQNGSKDSSAWRNEISYGAHPAHAGGRQAGREANSNFMVNRNYSPLRYLRTDDKDLTEGASRYMVDRGSHSPAEPIFKPETVSNSPQRMYNRSGGELQ